MENLGNNTNDTFERKNKKVKSYKRYSDLIDVYQRINGIVRDTYDIRSLPKRDDEYMYMSPLGIDDSIIEAGKMYEGKIEFKKEWFFQLFERLFNHEIFEILAKNDSLNLCNDKNFIIELMERSGAVLEIASFAGKDAIMQIFDDKELLGKIYNKEILTSSNLSGDEIISVLLLLLNYFEEITQDKSCMTKILKNIGEIENNEKSYPILAIISSVLARNCEELLKEREFTETVFDFIEDTYGEIPMSEFFENHPIKQPGSWC